MRSGNQKFADNRSSVANIATVAWTVRIAIALLLGTAAVFPAMAESANATDMQQVRPSASMDFRVVIPETVQIDSQSTRRARAQTFVSRNSSYEAGRMVLTVSRP